jgi:hypothetical protein
MYRLLCLIPLLLLTACGGGRETVAVETCSRGVAEKLEGKSYKLDTSDMLAKATTEGDVVTISSTVVFDPGLPSESTQVFECKARFTGETASVLSLNFIW